MDIQCRLHMPWCTTVVVQANKCCSKWRLLMNWQAVLKVAGRGGGTNPGEIKRLEEELHAKNAKIAFLKAMLQSMQPTEHVPAPIPALSLQEKWKTKCTLLFFGLFHDLISMLWLFSQSNGTCWPIILTVTSISITTMSCQFILKMLFC